MARHPIGWYTPTVKLYSIQLRTGSIISSNYVVLYLLVGKIYRSARSKLPPWEKIGTIPVLSLLLHIIFAQIWYETGQWRKVIRFPCKSWWFGGYLNASWGSVLEFEQTTTQVINNIIKQHWYTTTAWEGYQKAHFGVSYRLERPWYVFGTGVGDNRGKQVWKSCHYSWNLGGHRPPRRIRAYESRNNHNLDITSPVPPQNIYLVMLYR